MSVTFSSVRPRGKAEVTQQTIQKVGCSVWTGFDCVERLRLTVVHSWTNKQNLTDKYGNTGARVFIFHCSSYTDESYWSVVTLFDRIYWLALKCFDTTLIQKKKKIPKLFCKILSKYSKHDWLFSLWLTAPKWSEWN